MFWNKKKRTLTCYACGREIPHPSDRIRKHMMQYNFRAEDVPTHKDSYKRALVFEIYRIYCDDCYRIKQL